MAPGQVCFTLSDKKGVTKLKMKTIKDDWVTRSTCNGHGFIGTSYPKIATNFQPFYPIEIFALLLWNLSWRLLLPCFRFPQIFIIFCGVVLEICDSSFLKLSNIRGPFWGQNSHNYVPCIVNFERIAITLKDSDSTVLNEDKSCQSLKRSVAKTKIV